MPEHYTKKERLKRWRNYGVIPAFFPIVFASLCDLYLEYTLAQIISRHFLDFLLVTFAIAVSVFGAAMDLERDLSGKTRESYIVTSVLLGVISFAAYSFLYERDETENPYAMIAVRVAFVILAFIIVRKGFAVEGATASPFEKTENNKAS